MLPLSLITYAWPLGRPGNTPRSTAPVNRVHIIGWRKHGPALHGIYSWPARPPSLFIRVSDSCRSRGGTSGNNPSFGVHRPLPTDPALLLSGNPKEGGILDGHLRRVVMLPDDGHPDVAAYVVDLTGDARDEIVLWDQERVWIYTQDRPFTGRRIYAPVRNPDYNESNYRTTVSLPGWKDVP
jgi:hypothetical protein